MLSRGVPRESVFIDNGRRVVLVLRVPWIKDSVIPLHEPAASHQAEPPDDAHLAGLSQVDAEAFGVLYDRYCNQIYRYAHRRLGDHAAAEDVTAEVFLKALRAIASYQPDKAPFSAWLYRIAANAVVDHARSRKVNLSLDVAMELADQAPPVDEQAINRVEAAEVWRAVDALFDAQRRAVILRFGRDLPISAIAVDLGRSEGAVKLLLNRGLAAVREQLRATAEDRENRP
jgi:RNA polymerase sigma-70 factor (ECF subfamily)